MNVNRCEPQIATKAVSGHYDERMVRKECITPSSEWKQDFHEFCKAKYRYDVFKEYLATKRCGHLLDLWSIIKGYKNFFKEGQQPLNVSISGAAIAIEKQLNANDEWLNRWIKEETRRDAHAIIKRFKADGCDKKRLLENVFERAKYELEEGLKETFYMSFLKSDIYSNCLLHSFEEGKIINERDGLENKPCDVEKYSSHRYMKSEHAHEKMNVGTLPTVPKNEEDRKLVSQFADKLEKIASDKMEKMEKAKKAKENEEKDRSVLRKLKEMSGESFSALPPRLVLDAMEAQIKSTDTSGNDASDQSILDDHISRVFSPDNSPITRSRSEFNKSLPSNSSLSNPPVSCRDDYIDGFTSNQVTSEKSISYYKKPQPIKHTTYNKYVLHEHKNGNSYNDSEQPRKDIEKSLYRSHVKCMTRAYGDGMSSTNLNMITEESSFNQRRQEYEGFVKALPTPMGPGVISDKNRSKMDASKRFDKKRSIQQSSRVPVKLATKANDVLTVGYRYSDEKVPFLKKIHGCSSLTLYEFKQLIPKRNGPHTYYFRKESNEFGTGHVMEEITDDNELLPINEGNKIYGVVESGSRH